jgi:hypothetical protein
MFKRLLLEDSAAICTVVAFVTAVTIFVAIAWRALRMPRAQADRFANLPFTSESAATRHDSQA